MDKQRILNREYLDEEDLLDQIFDGPPKRGPKRPTWFVRFNDKEYAERFCSLCECFTLICLEPDCFGTSCNGGGCDKCHDDTTAYNLRDHYQPIGKP